MKVEERKVSVDEIEKALKENRVTEMFGAGTAATIAHIQLININGVDYTLPSIPERDFSNKVYNFLNDLKTGKVEDTFGWIYRV
jgi:branched-chain amino acid aminotransferase